jgi:hypothetical protein
MSNDHYTRVSNLNLDNELDDEGNASFTVTSCSEYQAMGSCFLNKQEATQLIGHLADVFKFTEDELRGQCCLEYPTDQTLNNYWEQEPKDG